MFRVYIPCRQEYLSSQRQLLFPKVPSKLQEDSLRATVEMAAVPEAMPIARFGLVDFDAIDTSGRPQFDDEEELADDYSGIKLSLGDEVDLGQGHLYISSKYACGFSHGLHSCFAGFRITVSP